MGLPLPILPCLACCLHESQLFSHSHQHLLTAARQYSMLSAYGAMFVGSSRPLGAKQIWKTSAPPRVKFFFRLVMHGHCWTAHKRRRHGLQESDACIICDQAVETMDHIILGCVFGREVWASCLRRFLSMT
jgi:hypothetical protein